MWKSTAFALIFAVPVMTKGGCDGCDPSSGGNGNVGVDTGGDDTAVEPDPCDGYAAQASEAAVQATPRARPELEQLAIELFPSFTADPAVYDRLVADLDAIGDDEPGLAGITYFAPYRGDQIIVGFDAATLPAVQNGTYTAWDCANDAYEFESATTGLEHAVLTFDGTYDVVKLADEYSRFPGVTYAEPNHRMGDGSTVCVVPDGTTWHWRLDQASGDCPAGCINHVFTYYTSSAAGTVENQGEWNADSPLLRPDWMDTFAACDE